MDDLTVPIVKDPGPPVSGKLNIHALPFSPSVDTGTWRAENPGSSGARILAVGMLDTQKRFHVHGSAVLVAPGVALCASHVIDGWEDSLKGRSVGVGCLGVGNGYGLFWAAKLVVSTPKSDISILALELMSAVPKDGELRICSISTRLPAIGEELLVSGWVPSAQHFEVQKDEGLVVDANLYLSRGPVVSCYAEGRDRIMMPGSCIEVDAEAFGCMSGGPVFDQHGYLVGLVSSSVSSPEACAPTFVSLIWPCLHVKFLGGWPLIAMEPLSLLDRAAHGLGCHIDHPEAIRIESSESGQIDVFLRAWTRIPK